MAEPASKQKRDSRGAGVVIFAVLAVGVLGMLFAVHAGNKGEFTGAGVCLIASAYAFTQLLREHFRA